MTGGSGNHGGVTGGHAVPFKTSSIRQFATEIAKDEYEHVAFLRSALGGAAVARPAIDIRQQLHRRRPRGRADREGTDVRPVRQREQLPARRVHLRGRRRDRLQGRGPADQQQDLPGARPRASWPSRPTTRPTSAPSLYDTGPGRATPTPSPPPATASTAQPTTTRASPGTARPTSCPTDDNGLAFGRTPGQVLNIVYLTPKVATKGGFYPARRQRPAAHQRLTNALARYDAAPSQYDTAARLARAAVRIQARSLTLSG